MKFKTGDVLIGTHSFKGVVVRVRFTYNDTTSPLIDAEVLEFTEKKYEPFYVGYQSLFYASGFEHYQPKEYKLEDCI